MNDTSHAHERYSIREEELIRRIGWFIRLRWMAGFGALVVLFVAWQVFQVHFPLLPVLLIVGAIFLYNIVFALIVRGREKQSALEYRQMVLCANLQVIADLFCLTLLIHFLGGVQNYFVVFYFFHMIIGSIILSKKNTYILAALAAVMLNSVIWGEYFGILKHYHYPGISLVSHHTFFNFCFTTAGIMTASLFISVYFATSITSRLRSREEELESAYRNLQLLDEEKTYFMRKASHELRSPVSAVQSMVRLVLDGLAGETGPKTREMLGRAYDRLSGMQDLVGDLLRFSQLRKLERPQKANQVDLQSIVHQSIELMSAWAKEKSLSLEVDIEQACVIGEEEGLQQVSNNLISNAVKYTPEGGKVFISLHPRDDRMVLSVRDTGIGISQEDQKKLFQEFFRAENAKEITGSGTGLGLSIVRRVVEMHGGSLDFSSELGKGSEFTASFPSCGAAGGLKPSKD
jgi:signal transduction histidine kinase